MEENKQTNDNEQPKVEQQSNQNVDPVSSTSTYKVSTQEPKKKKGKAGLIAVLIFIAILVVAIVAGLIYYFGFYMKPDQIYKRLVESTIDSYTEEIRELDYTTSKTSFKLNFNVDIDNEEIDEKILDLINKTDLKIETQTDNENKKMILNLESDYDGEDLLNFQVYSDIDEEKTYMQAKDLLNKYIEVEEIDDEFYSVMEEVLQNPKMTLAEKISLEKATKILKNELTKAIKQEYCSSQKEQITINGKNINATKNSIKMNQQQFMNEITTIMKNLRDNEEFLDCFEEKDELKKGLEELVYDLEELDLDDDEITIEISIYTQGFIPQVVKASGILYDESIDETVTAEITKTEKDTYDVVVSTSEDDEVLKGSINIEKKSDEEGILKLGFDIPELGKVTLNIEYSQKFNEDIDKINVKNSIKVDELTKADQQTLTKNLQKSKIYELVEGLSEATTESILDANTNIGLGNTDTTDNNKTSESSKDNEIISYDNKVKVMFKIPSGYKSRYVSDNYKSLEKDEVSIKIASQYGDKDKYYKSLEGNKEYFEKMDTYKNVKLSEMQTMEVNGKTFDYATLSYEYSGIGDTYKYETKYVWTEISNNYVMYFEIRDPENVTENELEELLTITVTNNK